MEGGPEQPGPTRKPTRSYEDLEVFQRAMALIRPIHDLVKTFPKYEEYDLAQQMRRASKSIPANIAEGFSRRRTPKGFKQYLGFAMGSANEMLIHLRIARELSYVDEEQFRGLTEAHEIVCKQLNRLIEAWK